MVDEPGPVAPQFCLLTGQQENDPMNGVVLFLRVVLLTVNRLPSDLGQQWLEHHLSPYLFLFRRRFAAADFQWTFQIDSCEMWCSPTPTRIPPYHRESLRNIGILACPFGVPTARQCDNRQRTSVRLLVRPFPSLDVPFTEMLTTSDSRKVDHPSSGVSGTESSLAIGSFVAFVGIPY